MTQDTEKDPFSKAFDSLWALAEQSSRLTSMVRPGNRIKHNRVDDLPVHKDEILNGDLPELTLLVTQMTGRIRATSSASFATLRYEWWLATGTRGITNAVLPLTFAVYAAMAPWPTTVVASANTALKWRGQSFIKRVDLLDAQFGLTRAELNRGVEGWSAVWAAEVEMAFSTTDIIQSNDLVEK